MSIRVKKFVECDECGSTVEVDSRSKKSQAREFVWTALGWHTFKHKDYCPSCSKRISER